MNFGDEYIIGFHQKRKPIDERFRCYAWAAVAGAAVSVVGGAIASNQAKKKAGAVAGYTPVDLQQEQRNALLGNMQNQPQINALAARTNAFDASQGLSLEEQISPGYANLRNKLQKQSSALLDDPYGVPKDVEDNLARIAAERGISAGTRGQFQDFSLLRDLGVNSLQYGQSRINQAGSLASLISSIAPKVNPTSPLSFYVTPQQQGANATNNNQMQQSVAQSANNANAAANNANNATWGNLINGATGLLSTGVQGYMNRPKTTSSSGSGFQLNSTDG